jgi:hypothetical protein
VTVTKKKWVYAEGKWSEYEDKHEFSDSTEYYMTDKLGNMKTVAKTYPGKRWPGENWYDRRH